MHQLTLSSSQCSNCCELVRGSAALMWTSDAPGNSAVHNRYIAELQIDRWTFGGSGRIGFSADGLHTSKGAIGFSFATPEGKP